MKKIFDQHLHSNFSFDSQEQIESYLKVAGENDIVTTEHNDFSIPYLNHKDILLDYEKYSLKIDELNRVYNNKFFKGIEIDFLKSKEKDILKYLKDKEFDLKLLSIHQNGEYDYMHMGNVKIDLEKHIQEYYSLMIEALESPVEANVLAHFEYGVRNVEASVCDLQKFGSKYLDKVIDLLIKKEMALELNTKSMYLYRKLPLYEYIVEKSVKKGLKLFTLGSDAHDISKYAYKFDEASKILLKNGIKEIPMFKVKEIIMLQLDWN